MIVLDANILVSAVIGQSVPRALNSAHGRGVTLGVAEPQVAEALRILIDKIGLSSAEARRGLGGIVAFVTPLERELYIALEQSARQRLHERGQSDWVVLAAALAVGGGIWSHDRDFFGVGVPVWSSRNMRFAT